MEASDFDRELLFVHSFCYSYTSKILLQGPTDMTKARPSLAQADRHISVADTQGESPIFYGGDSDFFACLIAI